MITNEELAQKAYDVTLEVMRANEKNHEPGEWERQTADEHQKHAINHLLLKPANKWKHDPEDLKSAHVRSLMALVVYEKEG